MIIMGQASDPADMIGHWNDLNMWTFADPPRRSYMEKMLVQSHEHEL